MKFSLSSLLVAATAASAAPTTSYFTGFNLGSQTQSGACKTQEQWQQEFTKIKSWSTGPKAQFNVIKLFSTADCDALKNAVPAAQAAGVKIWAGVWAVDNAKFGREKAALEAVIRQYGSGWLAGVNVGSESLYRKEISADSLAGYIYDVKGMVQVALGAPQVPVGTADTWTSWVDGANKPVITASDVILMNGFPYWQGSTIEDSLATFQKSIAATQAVIDGKPLIVGETGWPTAGPNFGNAVANRENLQAYWKGVACWLQSQGMSWLWFSAFDEPQRESTIEKNFGTAWSGQTLKLSLTC